MCYSQEGDDAVAKATMTLPNGTKVDIEGTTDEVEHLLSRLGQLSTSDRTIMLPPPAPIKKRARRQRRENQSSKSTMANDRSAVDITAIVNTVKNCDEAESIEETILDKTSQVDRTLLPLYVVHEYMKEKTGLTSGDINRVTRQLGIPISTANASSTLSGTASRYVMADSVRKKGGVPVRYTLSRKGVQYMKDILAGKNNEAAK